MPLDLDIHISRDATDIIIPAGIILVFGAALVTCITVVQDAPVGCTDYAYRVTPQSYQFACTHRDQRMRHDGDVVYCECAREDGGAR